MKISELKEMFREHVTTFYDFEELNKHERKMLYDDFEEAANTFNTIRDFSREEKRMLVNSIANQEIFEDIELGDEYELSNKICKIFDIITLQLYDEFIGLDTDPHYDGFKERHPEYFVEYE